MSHQPATILKSTAISVVFVGLLLPFLAFAQTDLSATIREQILRDPRTAQMTDAQLDAVIAALTQNARVQGMTAADIQWQPYIDSVAGTCSLPHVLCDLNAAFGFDGSDLRIPIGLGLSSMALVALLAFLAEHHRKEIEVGQTQ